MTKSYFACRSPGSNHPIVDSDHVCQWAKQVGGEQEKMCSEEITIVDQVLAAKVKGIGIETVCFQS